SRSAATSSLLFIVKPTHHEVLRTRFKFRGILYFAQSLHEFRTARMEPASGRRLHEAWGLAGRYIFEGGSVFGIRIWNRRKECPRIWMKGIVYELGDYRFFDDLSGIHNED